MKQSQNNEAYLISELRGLPSPKLNNFRKREILETLIKKERKILKRNLMLKPFKYVGGFGLSVAVLMGFFLFVHEENSSNSLVLNETSTGSKHGTASKYASSVSILSVEDVLSIQYTETGEDFPNSKYANDKQVRKIIDFLNSSQEVEVYKGATPKGRNGITINLKSGETVILYPAENGFLIFKDKKRYIIKQPQSKGLWDLLEIK